MSQTTEQDLVTANHILSNEGVLDAFGHVTTRNPEEDDQMLVSSYQSPALVEEDDLLEMTLDGEVFDDDVEEIYSENVIHRAIYRARPDVNAVIHCHAEPLIPFTVTDVEIKPVTHMGAPSTRASRPSVSTPRNAAASSSRPTFSTCYDLMSYFPNRRDSEVYFTVIQSVII